MAKAAAEKTAQAESAAVKTARTDETSARGGKIEDVRQQDPADSNPQKAQAALNGQASVAKKVTGEKVQDNDEKAAPGEDDKSKTENKAGAVQTRRKGETDGKKDGNVVKEKLADEVDEKIKKKDGNIKGKTEEVKGGTLKDLMKKGQLEDKTTPEQKRADIMDQINGNEKTKEAYEKLSPEQKKQFMELGEKLYYKRDPGLVQLMGMGGIGGMMSQGAAKKNPDGTEKGTTRATYMQLLEQGKLTQQDSQGKTMLDNLYQIGTQEYEKGQQGDGVLRETVDRIANPQFFTPNPPDSRASLALHEISKDNPAEYARLVAGVTGKQGQVELSGGEVLKRDPSTFKLNQFNMPCTVEETLSKSIESHLNNKKIPMSQTNGEIMQRINGDAKTKDAFDKLSPEEQTAFMKVARDSYLNGMEIGGKQIKGGVDPSLLSIMEQGKLNQKDSTGQTLLHNLDAMANQKFAEGLDGNKIFRETTADIADPDRIKQGYKGTCTVTCLQYLNAKQNPAEYARIMAGLTGEKGEVKLRNGDTMKRDEGLIEQDYSGRTDVERIYQGSMMEYGNGLLQNYYNDKDTSYKVHQKVKVIDGPDGKKHIVNDGAFETEFAPGLSDQNLSRPLNGVLPYDTEMKSYDQKNSPASQQKTEKELQQALQSGKTVVVSLDWGKNASGGTAGHELVVEKIEGEFVYIRNPWGDGDQGGKADTTKNLPERIVTKGDGKSGSGGHIKISKKEFYERLNNYHLPK